VSLVGTALCALAAGIVYVATKHGARTELLPAGSRWWNQHTHVCVTSAKHAQTLGNLTPLCWREILLASTNMPSS